MCAGVYIKPDDVDDEGVPMEVPSTPFLLDDNSGAEGDDDDDEAHVRARLDAARTVFHQPRSDNDTMNSTRSLYDEDIVYFYIGLRRYTGDYYMPNDDDEVGRLAMLHEIFFPLLGHQHTTVPLSDPSHILDIGTGAGDWVLAMGDLYPMAEITGTDIAKVQPNAVPLNAFFVIDDAEYEGGWTWPENEFDLIHFRMMEGSFKDWAKMYALSFKHLKPGGYIEVIDFDNHNDFISYFSAESETARYLTAINKAAQNNSRPRGMVHLLPEIFENAGFTDVKITEKNIPMGTWPDSQQDRRVGKQFLVAELCAIEAHALRPLMEAGWEVEEIMTLCHGVQEEMKELAKDRKRSRGLGLNIRIVSARKPPSTDD